MELANFLNISGLVLDIVGVVLLFKFGLPPNGVSRRGPSLLLEQDDPERSNKVKLYDRISYAALAILIVGFTLQIIANTSLVQNESPEDRRLVSSFEKNLFCLEKEDVLSSRLSQDDSPFGDLSLEQIFYSPKEESCLYVEYSEKGNFYNKRLFDIRNDSDTSKPLEMCSAEYPSLDANEMYDEEIEYSRYQDRLAGCRDFTDQIEKYK